MSKSNATRKRLSFLSLTAALAAAGCDGSGYSYGAGPDNGNPGAYSPSVSIVSPSKGGAVTGGQLQVRLRTGYFSIVSPGAPLKDGEGHVHVYLDKPAAGSAYDAVIKEGGAEAAVALPMPAAPGKHYLIVSLQKNDHSPYGVQDSVAFTVQEAGNTRPGGNNGGYDYGY